MKNINHISGSFSGLKEIDTVIWDWNGTLLDDVEVNLKVINTMLSRRNLPLLDLDSYKNSFCFPVQSFQSKIGFDYSAESVYEISMEYHAIYRSFEAEINLNADARFVLKTLGQKRLNQYILSASHRDYLTRTVNDFGLSTHFKALYGVNDAYASGKTELGRQLIRDYGLNPARTLIVGDTLHDAEVAAELGVNHVLFSGGHNSYDLLNKNSVVITTLRDLTSED